MRRIAQASTWLSHPMEDELGTDQFHEGSIVFLGKQLVCKVQLLPHFNFTSGAGIPNFLRIKSNHLVGSLPKIAPKLGSS